MLQAPIPANDQERLEALRSLDILDSPPEERFDRITRIAQHVFGVPIVLVSLVDENRQWFKSCVGLPVSETPRDVSFCGHAILTRENLYVPDTLEDPRFVDNPLVVSDPNIRFYAGAPLSLNSGAQVGTLCIIDSQPHRLSQEQLAILRELADMVELELQRNELIEATRLFKRQQAHLSAILNSIQEGILLIDKQSAVVSVNPSAEYMLATTKTALLGKQATKILPELNIRKHSVPLKSLYFADKRKGVETFAVTRQGMQIPVEITVTGFELEGEPFSTVVLRDITEQKRLEQMKNDFVCTVSHELRTPLTSIRGSLGLLASGKLGDLDDQMMQMITIAEQNSARLVRLVNDILDIEKLEFGKLEVDLSKQDINALIDSTVRENLAFAQQHQITFNICGDRVPVAVQVDADRFVQVLTNLLSNAIKFSPQGSVVTLETTVSDRIYLRVMDQGPGIPLEKRDRLFQKFSQIDKTSSSAMPGTGLGLSIVKSIMAHFNGDVIYEARDDCGACFTLSLPKI